ncbi:MAG: hypothetical protein VR73_08410 [Gammaproteobacteria bacterium BRH_c0]|nr:MAG: hypothetical protein VR73_08410 [Gammaproteobacteria bacterium BRH_c0]
MTITITCVFGKFTAFVLGILVEMNVAQVHSRVFWCCTERNRIATYNRVNIPWRLWPKTLSIGIFLQILALMCNDFI